MKVCFIQKQLFSYFGIMAISGVLKQQGYQTDVLIQACERNITAKLKKIKPDISYQMEFLRFEPPFLTNHKDKFVKLLQKTAQDELRAKVPLVSSGAGSVGSVITELNIPIINSFGCKSSNVHAPNEWIDLDTLPKVFEIYKKAILEFCE